MIALNQNWIIKQLQNLEVRFPTTFNTGHQQRVSTSITIQNEYIGIRYLNQA